MKENRIVFIDYLRVVACFLVMLVHDIPCIAVLTFICCAITTKLVSVVPGSKWIVGC